MANGAYGENDKPLENTSGAYGANDKPVGAEVEKSSSLIRRAGDQGIKLAQGVIGLPESFVGLADLATNGQAGKLAESAGVRFKDAKNILGEYLSPEQKAADAEVASAQGFFPTIGAAIKNPSTILGGAVESAPSMLGGGAISQGIKRLATKMSPILAGALGEGAVAAGQNAEQVRQQDADGTLTPQQSAILAASGLLTGGISLASGKLANKLGIGDLQTMMAQGKLGLADDAAGAVSKGFPRRIAEGFANEGIGQELPQSFQEQVAQNLATGKPWDEGAANAAAMGMLSGGLTGAGANLISGNQTAKPAPDATQQTADLNQANNELGAVADQYGDLTTQQQIGYNGQPSTNTIIPENVSGRPFPRNIVEVERQDGQGTTTIDRATGPLSNAAADAVEGGLTASMAAQVGPLIKSYPTQQEAQTALEQHETPDRMTIGRHPRATDRFSVLPRTAAELQAMDAKVAATEMAQTRTQQVEQEDGNAAPQAEATVDDFAHLASTSPLNNRPDPTEAQKAAGNYAKAHIALNGLGITLENPVGSMRSGTDENGNAWETELQSHYGYVKGSIGNDKDNVDVFIKPQTPLSFAGPVFVVDQINPETGAFDEHKAIIGAQTMEEAQALYQANYAKGWNGMGPVTEMPFTAFKSWVRNGEKNVPLSQDVQAQEAIQAEISQSVGAPLSQTGQSPLEAAGQMDRSRKGQPDARVQRTSPARDAARKTSPGMTSQAQANRPTQGEPLKTVESAQIQGTGDQSLGQSSSINATSPQGAAQEGKESKTRSKRQYGETNEAYLTRRAAELNAQKQQPGQKTIPTKGSDTEAARTALGSKSNGTEEAVPVADLPDAPQAEKNQVSKQTATFINHVAKLFGKRAVFVKGMEADGMRVAGNTVYLSTHSSVAHLRVFGHEMLHALKAQNAKAYNQMLDAVQHLLTDTEYAAQYKDYNGAEMPEGYLTDKTRAFLAEEWMADLSGNRFAEAGFWSDVFTQVEATHGTVAAKSIIARLRLAIVNALNKLMKMVQGNQFAVDARMGEHLEEIRKAVADGFAQYAKAVKDGQVSMEVDDDVKFAASRRPARDPAIGDSTDVGKLPKGRVIPKSVAIGGLESSLGIARGKTYAKGRDLKLDIQAAVLNAARAAGVRLHERTQETHKFLAGMVFADAAYALSSNENAIGWYDSKISRAIGALAVVHPEINTDPTARLAFMWSLAVTSNGLKVGKNFELAERAYRAWRDSNSVVAQRTLPTDIGIGNAASAINDGMALFNTLSKKMDQRRLAKFMATEFPAGSIAQMLGVKAGGEWAGTPVRGAAILGPKIGNGFYMNLNGYFDALTMDRWLMRTFGRMTGTLLEIDPVKIRAARVKFKGVVAKLSRGERASMSELVGQPVRASMTAVELDALAAAIDKASMKTDKRAMMQASEATNRFRLDGRGLAKALDGQKEAPGGPAERNWIRAIFRTALNQLKADGKNMTMSDLQALLWYPERRLYDAAKSDDTMEEGYEDDEAPDYANAALALAVENGHQRSDVLAAMDKAESAGTIRAETMTDAEKAEMSREFRAPPDQGVQLAFEVAPDPANVEATAQWNALSLKDRTAITKEVKDAFMPEIFAIAETETGKTVAATGGFEGLVNPNVITEYKTSKVSLQKARSLAASIGLVLDQDSVAVVDPRIEVVNGLIRITFSGKVEKHVKAVFDHLHAAIPEVDAFTARGNNFDILNFTGMSDEALNDRVADALADLELDLDAVTSFGDVRSELVRKGDYESYIQGARPGSGQEVYERALRVRDRVRAFVSERVGAKSVSGLAGAVQRGGASAQLGETKLSTARSGDGQRGIYGEGGPGSPAHSVSLTGVHFSKQARTSLLGAYNGTGLKGAELKRLAESNDQRIKSRVYFYVDEGKGLTPESGVGGVAHSADLKNLYNTTGDPLKLFKANDLNGSETRVLDAGYNGYYFPNYVNGQGIAIVLGKAADSIPVTLTGYGKGQAPTAQAQPYKRGLTSKELSSIDLAAVQEVAPSAKLRTGTLSVDQTELAAARAELAKQGIELPEAKLSTKRDDMFPGEFATKRTTVDTGIQISSKGATLKGGNVNSAGQQISATKQALQNFWNWFGQSEATDSDGKPLLMYHSTNADTAVLKAGQKTTNNYGLLGDVELSRAGIFATPEKDFSQEYLREGSGKNVMPIYMSLQKPFDSRNGISEQQEKELIDAGVSSRWLYDYQHDWEMYDNADDGSNFFVEKLKELGYDGAVFNEDGQDGKSHVTYMAFDSNQIKSATGNLGTFDAKNSDVRFSNTRQPFYSALSKEIGAIKMQAAPAFGWKDAIKGMVNKGLIKQDEVEWSGLNDWLELQTGKVTRDQVTQYLDANGVKVNEVTLTNPEDMIDMLNDKLSASYDYGAYYEAGDVYYIDPDGDVVSYKDLPTQAKRIVDEFGQVNGQGAKYDQYNLPGGTNYREVLLTLPVKNQVPIERMKVVKREDGNFDVMDKEGVVKSFREWGEATAYAYDQEQNAHIERNRKNNSTGYKSAHWDQPNVLAHIRVDDRVDADGSKVLMVQEIQSDWGQQGKKQGFNTSYTKQVKPGEHDAFIKSLKEKASAHAMEKAGLDKETADRMAAGLGHDTLADMVGMRSELNDLLRRQSEDRAAEHKGSVPAAPFVTNTTGWLNLALKRVITMAVQGGYDKVAFVNGEQSADRYDLSKQVDRIVWLPDTGYGGEMKAYDANRTEVISRSNVKNADLSDLVGKEVADRILSKEPGPDGFVELENQDLKIGGSGMIAFYDKIVPNAASALLKKLGGGKMETVSGMVSDKDGWHITPPSNTVRKMWMVKSRDYNSTGLFFDTEDEAKQALAEKQVSLDQPGFTLTPSLREKASGGLPMFSNKRQTDTPEFKAWFGGSKVVDAQGKPLVVYHGTGSDINQFSSSATVDGAFHFGTIDAANDRIDQQYGMEEEDYFIPNVIPVFLSIHNPMRVVDQEGSIEGWKKAIREAKKLGYDGLVYANAYEGVGLDSWVAFKPTQVKSTIGNNGNFDAANPDIRESKARIVGDQGRTYTADQLKAFKNVGFQVEDKTLAERAKELWQDAGKKMAQGIADQFAPVKALDGTAYGLLRLAKGASGAFEAMLQGGKLKLTDNVYDIGERGGVVDRLLKPLQGEHHDFMRWVAAHRAEALSQVGKEHLFTADDIKALKSLADGQTKFNYTIQNGIRKGQVTRNRAEIYRDAQETFKGFNKNVLDMAEQSGLIDGASRKLWENEFYVPFYRVADDADGGVRGMNIKGAAVRQQAFKALKGGKNALNADLLDNTLMNWAHLLDAAAKNRAAKATIDAAEKMGIAMGGNQTTLAQMGASMHNKNGVVWFMDGGVKRYSLLDNTGDGPYIMTALTSLEYAGMRNPVMNAMGAMKYALTFGVTASPFFKVRNLIRDSVQVIGTGPISYNPAKNLKEGWKLTDPKSDAYFRLLAGGGTIHFGTMMEGSEAKRVQALVESGIDSSSILDSDQKVKAFYRKFIEPGITAYNELGNRGEAVNRASLYDQLRKQGVNHADASLQARDLMDFSMQGSWTSIRFLTQVVPFMNARIQGLYKLGKAAKEDPMRFSAVLGATTLASLALLAAFSDDDDWKKRSDADRNNFWWFKFGGQAFRIPKPFEIGAIATLAERGFELAFDKEMTDKRFMSQVMTLLGDNLSMNPVPQLVKPIMDVYANKNSFSGMPIENMAQEKLQSAYRFNDRTSMFARGASTAMNAVTGLANKEALSPVQIDHMLQGYFGWLGTFVVSSGDVLARPATNQPKQAAPDYMKVVTGNMVSDLRDAPSRYVSQMYDQAQVIEKAYGTWRALLKEGKVEEAKAFREDNKEVLAKYQNVEAVKRSESLFNQMMRRVERNTEMDPAAKRERIRQIQQQKDQAARRVASL